MVSGIYLIKNKKNGKKYVGQAVSITRRWNRHRSDLRLNRHGNQHLQNAWNKYGEENFTFEVLEKCDKSLLLERESFYSELLQPEYNKRIPTETSFRQIISEQRKFELRQHAKKYLIRKGTKHTEDSKKRMGKSRSGEKCWCAKLTWEMVREIRQKYIPYKYSVYRLAKEYNVAKTTIEAIVTGRSWRE